MANAHHDKHHRLPELVDRIAATPVYRVLLLANLIGRPFFGRFGKRHGLTLNEWRIMTVLAGNPGVSISGICNLTGLHIMNVSRGVKGLERQGRTIRRVDPADRRRSVLELSDSGLEVLLTLAPQALAWADTVCDVLSERETRTFDRLLKKMTDQARAEGETD